MVRPWGKVQLFLMSAGGPEKAPEFLGRRTGRGYFAKYAVTTKPFRARRNRQAFVANAP